MPEELWLIANMQKVSFQDDGNVSQLDSETFPSMFHYLCN
jgi:hypothetical protein